LIISPQSIKIPLVDRFINYFREENNNTTLKPGWAPFPGSSPRESHGRSPVTAECFEKAWGVGEGIFAWDFHANMGI
jgi:hypothetical protein